MINVLTGVNGAGKSTIGGAAIRAAGQAWHNPDELARAMAGLYTDRSLEEINGRVWEVGRQRLAAAIREDTDFAFETTLGGSTITLMLLDAIAAGVRVSVWYCGLDTPDRHIERVAARVARGGHDIPEALIRDRCRHSIRNLCRLAPGLHQLAVYDNSRPLDEQGRPQVRRLVHVVGGELRELDIDMPQWAKPIAAVCLRTWGTAT